MRSAKSACNPNLPKLRRCCRCARSAVRCAGAQFVATPVFMNEGEGVWTAKLRNACDKSNKALLLSSSLKSLSRPSCLAKAIIDLSIPSTPIPLCSLRPRRTMSVPLKFTGYGAKSQETWKSLEKVNLFALELAGTRHAITDSLKD